MDWSADRWKQVIVSDKPSFSIFPTAGRVYVWRQPKEAYNPDCLLPTLKHEDGSEIDWAAISRNSLGSIIALHARINSKIYLNILRDHVSTMVQALFHYFFITIALIFQVRQSGYANPLTLKRKENYPTNQVTNSSLRLFS